jgi:glycosyltransferase involved in cell wall biosynthesis
MRVLVATILQNVVGGVETYLHALLPALRARGHEVALCCEQAADPSLPLIGSQDVPVLTGCDLRSVSAWRPDVVYSQGLQSPQLEEAFVRAYPTVLFAHNYHGTCISGTKMQAAPCPRPCQRTLGPGCLAAYLPRRCGGLNPWTAWTLYRTQQQRRRLLDRYAAVAVASRWMFEEYRRHGVAEDRLHLLPLFPPGVEPDAQPPLERALTGQILMVGRLTALKGGLCLVEAVGQARRLRRDLTLVVAGDGPERQPMADAARRFDVPVRFAGWVGVAEREALMREADLLAVPSLWPEPFGLVGIEAGCVGLAAVGYAVGGVPDWLVPGQSGELAPAPPTAKGLADAISRALADPAHLGRLRRGAWETARRHSPDAHLTALEDLLAGACAPSQRPARDVTRPRLHPEKQ